LEITKDMITDQKITDWPLVTNCVLVGVIAAIHFGKLPPALPIIRQDLGLSLIAGGWAASIFSLTGVVLGLFAGALGDRIGQRIVLMLGAGFLAAGSLTGGYAETESGLLISRFLEGVGFTLATVPAASVIAEATEKKDLHRALALWGAYFPMGLFLIMIAAPYVINSVGWRPLWQGSGLLTLAWMIVLWRATAGYGVSDQGRIRESFWLSVRSTLTRWAPWLLSGMFGLFAFQTVALLTWFPTFLVEERGMDLVTASLMLALLMLCNTAGNMTAGSLLTRGLELWKIYIVTGAIICLLSIVIYSSALPDLVRLIACMAFTLIGGMLPTAIFSGAPLYAPTPAQIGTINGLIVMVLSMGQLGGPIASAAIVEVTGRWENVGWVMGIASIGIVILGLVIRNIDKELIS
jgi:MFS family permease